MLGRAGGTWEWEKKHDENIPHFTGWNGKKIKEMVRIL